MLGKRGREVRFIATLFCAGIGITMLLPLVWMISTSFKYESDVFVFPIQWIPERTVGFDNYKEVWGQTYQFGMYYWNSIKITVISTALQLLISAMGAYGFTKIEFKGRNALFLLYLATMMIPHQITIIPQFLVLKEMGLYNTHLGIILMLTFSVYGVFLLRQNIMGLPNSLCEAAKIEGAGHLQIFLRIILPLLKPAIATLAILKFVWTWNDYQTPLILLSSRELYTIQLGMKMFATESGSYYALIMAAAVSATVPLIILFLAGQKYVIEGIASGAVKG